MTEPPDEASRVYVIRLDPRARAEIDAAHPRFIEIVGAVIADEWQDGLLAALARLPRRHPVAPENACFAREVRQLVYRRLPGTVAYRVLFTVIAQSENEPPLVYVLHVLHGAVRLMTLTEARRIETGNE